MDLGLFILRAVVGGLFVGHGTQKLFGWFGGYGLDGVGGFFAKLGYPKSKHMAALAGIAEAGGGLLLVLGFLTPLGAAAIIGVMVNAILAVHADKGVWNENGGLELPLVYATAAATLAFTGPGVLSVDNAIGPFEGYLYGFATIALGLITGVIVHSTREEETAVENEQAEERGRAA